MGIFLPFTIYLQSVLGFSALKAGLTMAPASLISMVVSPVAGRMTDKIGGKYILMGGLFLFGVGMGWLALIAHPTSSWQSFLAPLLLAGLGMGCTFAPLVTTAMRNIQPQIAGAASGVLNTVRQVGLVIGTAAVGALLQNRLVSEMTAQAHARSAALPARVRNTFIGEIQSSASNGIQVGAGQNGGISRQTGLPASLAAEVARIGHDVFTFGYVAAMRSTMILPVVLLGVGAALCLALTGQRRAARAPAGQPAQAGAGLAAQPAVPGQAAVPDAELADGVVADGQVASAVVHTPTRPA
jgi:MFS family permease